MIGNTGIGNTGSGSTGIGNIDTANIDTRSTATGVTVIIAAQELLSGCEHVLPSLQTTCHPHVVAATFSGASLSSWRSAEETVRLSHFWQRLPQRLVRVLSM